jgi:hypothetical protein
MRAMVLVLLLVVPGCDRPMDAAPTKPPVARAPKDSLVFGCSHVVVGPDLIRGVLVATNRGDKPIALIDRWNSWGAYQWAVGIGKRDAGNPQHDWFANYYTETILLPGETRSARFIITRFHDSAALKDGEWWFVLGEPDGIAAPGSPFAAGEALTLFMDGNKGEPSEGDHSPEALLWSSLVSTSSKELTELDALDRLARGKPLR